MDEILVKGQDGKWYILKGEELLPYGSEATEVVSQKAQNPNVSSVTLPKGITQKTYDHLETANSQKITIQPAQNNSVVSVSPPSVVSVSHSEHPLRIELEELIDQVVQKCVASGFIPDMGGTPDASEQSSVRGRQGAALQDRESLQKRFRTIVSARLRDVRDSSETREMLMRAQKVGGMGLPPPPPSPLNPPSGRGEKLRTGGEIVDLIIEIIEKAFKEFKAKWKDQEEKKRIALREKQTQERSEREGQKVKQEEEGLEERYNRLTGGNSKPALPAGRSKEVATAPPAGGSLAMTKSKALPPPPPLQSTQVAPLAKPKPVILAASKQVVPQKSFVPSVEQSSVSLRSGKVTDIRSAPKLVGPIEEIGSLRLEDFRRFPEPDAQARAQKIIEKIELLGKESLVRRSQGLEAWRSSPLNQLYGQILGTALSKRSSPQVILEELATAGKTTLTLDEFRAIMELNQKLRF
ncbi:MAG: hypothetical protein Q7S48_04890 [bacterium]|nr:hypothetical protein [bacterium]